jgi:tetratricopeptide (TPR) repeat protein
VRLGRNGSARSRGACRPPRDRPRAGAGRRRPRRRGDRGGPARARACTGPRDEGLTAEAELAHGSLLLDSGEIAAAATELERAYLSAIGIDHDRIAFDAALALTSLYASHRQDLEACRLWVDRAAAALERDASRSDPARRGRLALARAKQHFSAGEHADALPHAREAASLLEDADDPAASGAIDVLAKLLANLGSHDEALAEARRGIEVARRTRGDNHPAVAAALTTYAAMRTGPDQAGEALESLEAALAIYRDVRGDDDLAVAEVRRRMGNAHAQLGRKEAAARLYREALEAQRRRLPADDTKIAQTLYSLSTAVRALGDLKEAESLGREALRIAEATIGEEHFTTVIYVHGLAETLLASDPETAGQMLERGRGIVARRLGEDHHLHAAFLTSLGKHARGRGDLDRAKERLQASLAIHDGPARGVDPEAREETSRELEGVITALDRSPEGAGT